MAEVTLCIGDRDHRIACADGQEARLTALGVMLDARWSGARRASGGINYERTMLYIALMLADALDEAQATPRPAVGARSGDDALAERLEAIANALELEGAGA